MKHIAFFLNFLFDVLVVVLTLCDAKLYLYIAVYYNVIHFSD